MNVVVCYRRPQEFFFTLALLLFAVLLLWPGPILAQQQHQHQHPHNHPHHLCPVSSTDPLPWLSYPLDIYGSSPSSPSLNPPSSFACRAFESKEHDSHTPFKTYEERMVDYTCPPAATAAAAVAPARCPVTVKHHTDFAHGPHTLPTSNSTFCSWARRTILNNSSSSSSSSTSTSSSSSEIAHVNIVVLGGSVAMGFGARGCCCETDAHCTANPGFNATCTEDSAYSRATVRPMITCPSDSYYVPASFGCSWSGRLVRWLNREYAGRVRFTLRNLAEGSANSQHSSDVLHKQLRAYNLSLTGSDLIFLDHSVNDAGYTPKVGEGATFGLERLIRKVYQHSSNPPPALLLLESFPYLSPEANRRNYPDLARHYNLMHWNFRQVVDGLPPYIPAPGQKAGGSANLTGEDLINEHLRLHYLTFQDIHMSWHVHLFLAELIAGNFRRAATACAAHSAPTPPVTPVTAATPATPAYPATAGRDGGAGPFLPPAPFHNLPRDSSCASDHQPLVDMDAVDLWTVTASSTNINTNTNTNSNTNTGTGNASIPGLVVGSVSVVGNHTAGGGWKLLEDRPRKFGWVIDIDSLGGSNESSSGLLRRTSTLRFTPSPVALQALAALPATSRIILRVFYLSTYGNAGTALVSFCGVPVNGGFGINQGIVDALWPAYKTYHVSSTELWEQEVRWHSAAASWSREEDDWKLHQCTGDGRDLEIIYGAAGTATGDASEAKARGKQKIRVIGVKVCVSQRQG